MQTKPLILALLAGLSLSGAAQATLTDRGGGLIYDSLLNLTWLQDANLAATNTFGVSGIGSDGRMPWDTAQSWIGAMNTANYQGYSNWRLPTMVDTGSPGCNGAVSGTDCGFNVQTVSGGTTYSELATLYYVDLGNKAYYDTSGKVQSGFGLVNTGPFTNLQSDGYWSGLEYGPVPDYAWSFYANVGYQSADVKSNGFYAWAVRSGDVATAPSNKVPEPTTMVLLGLGMGALGLARRRG